MRSSNNIYPAQKGMSEDARKERKAKNIKKKKKEKNVMSTAQKILTFAVGLIMAVIFIIAGFNLFNRGKDSINNSTNQYYEIASQYDDLTYTQYEGAIVVGSEVVRMVKALQTSTDGVEIKVVTKANASSSETGTVYDADTNLTTFQSDKSSNNYINERGNFKCTITRSGNGVIEQVVFTQK